MDGEQEAHLIALLCGPAPEGQTRWTVRLLADRFVQLAGSAAVSRETVRRVLARNELKLGSRRNGAFPPDASVEFVAHMEDVLDVYVRPYDPRLPQVCMDETSKQLVGETRVPVPAAPGRPVRYDYEYERQGVSNLFLLVERLRG